MTLYRLKIQLFGKIVTPPVGDTIFGHFVWGIARREGQKSVAEFLDSLEEKPFIVSSAFPEGYLPKPILAVTWADQKEKYSCLKQLKKIKYIPSTLFEEGKPLSESLLLETIERAASEQKEILQIENDRLHATVDRFGQGTLEDIGLFAVPEKWLAWKDGDQKLPNPVFDIYLLASFEKDILLKMSHWAFENGFGADTSTGAGHIEVISLEEAKFPSSGNRAMALGPFVPPADSPINDLRANTFVRRGKLAFELGDSMNPFKKPIVFFDQGATFSFHEGMRPYIGSMVRNVHSDNRIVQQGWAPIIRYSEEAS
jgi:CRISPR-associated protein Csm4